MTGFRRRTPLGRFLLVGVAATLALACTADAVQTTKTPNSVVIAYSLAGGAISPDYFPVLLTPTLIMGMTTTYAYWGIGQVSVLTVPPNNDPVYFTTGGVEWTGLNSLTNTANSGKPSSGFSGTPGTRIIAVSSGDQLLLEVGTAKGSVRVHNTSTTIPMAGSMTWIW